MSIKQLKRNLKNAILINESRNPDNLEVYYNILDSNVNLKLIENVSIKRLTQANNPSLIFGVFFPNPKNIFRSNTYRLSFHNVIDYENFMQSIKLSKQKPIAYYYSKYFCVNYSVFLTLPLACNTTLLKYPLSQFYQSLFLKALLIKSMSVLIDDQSNVNAEETLLKNVIL